MKLVAIVLLCWLLSIMLASWLAYAAGYDAGASEWLRQPIEASQP